jgi:HAD superfamily hydrolase (TIGR01509 family)
MHELVIFDCDGVLVDSEVISNNVLARMLTREGLPTTLTKARRDYQGLLLADIHSRAEAKLGQSLPPGWLAEYEHERAEEFHRSLKPVPGAAEAVRRVKAAGLKVCVASQGALEKTRMTLGLTGLRDLFQPYALFSAHDVPRPKPDRALFQHAAATMDAKPSACVVIEDTPRESWLPSPPGCGLSATPPTATSAPFATLVPRSSVPWTTSRSSWACSQRKPSARRPAQTAAACSASGRGVDFGHVDSADGIKSRGRLVGARASAWRHRAVLRRALELCR